MVTASSGTRMPQGLNPNAVTDSCVALGEMAPYSYPDGPLGSFGRIVLAEGEELVCGKEEGQVCIS